MKPPSKRQSHDGKYVDATKQEQGILGQAFPLASALQDAGDAFLKDRRRFHDPECVRDIVRARAGISPLAMQLGTVITHTERDGRSGSTETLSKSGDHSVIRRRSA